MKKIKKKVIKIKKIKISKIFKKLKKFFVKEIFNSFTIKNLVLCIINFDLKILYIYITKY